MNDELLDPVPISALQHWSYCPRQCALIHVEQVFANNVYTARGNAVHALVDQPGAERSGTVRIERAMPLWCDRLGLVGKADLVDRSHPRDKVRDGVTRMEVHQEVGVR